ncbi:MAG: TlyA family RNA methyltransferase [Pseudomonadota bacterium]
MSEKIDRADKVLVTLGHFESRSAAQAAIAAGRVRVNGGTVTKPSEKIARDARIEATKAHPWVSRAGIKLAHAIDQFEIEVGSNVCLDLGASTGGFTDVLLAHGAASVVAVDVGRGQLHPRIAGEPRVTALEGQDARALTAEKIGAAPSMIVCDASFISLHKLLPAPLALAADNAVLIALFKPQFEVGRKHVGKGGIVTNSAAITLAETAFVEWLTAQGWPVIGRTDSPIKGGDGNAERLIYARRD